MIIKQFLKRRYKYYLYNQPSKTKHKKRKLQTDQNPHPIISECLTQLIRDKRLSKRFLIKTEIY